MAPNPGFALSAMHHRVPAVLGLNLQHGFSREIVEKGSAFDFRFDDVVVDGIVEIGMAAKELWAGMHQRPLNLALSINLQCNRRSLSLVSETLGY